MQDKYQIEIDEFRERFSDFKDKRIILYGIGRYTATLVSGLPEFKLTGLMDKDPNNIGKEMFNLPIVSVKQAETRGDLVIINTSETYWDVIYSRIENIKIPVYYKNGEQAKKKTFKGSDNPYAKLSLDSLHKEIDKAEVISFDFFDTLFMRRLCNPRDVFLLIEKEFADRWTFCDPYALVRNKALQAMGENYTLEQLYGEIQRITDVPCSLLKKMREREIELEANLLYPRSAVLNAMRYAVKEGKDVYIISDMYLPSTFYARELENYDISIDKVRILISCEIGKNKQDGSLWKHYREIIGNKRALHVGDNDKADLEMPKKYSIKAYQTPSAWHLLQASSLCGLAPNITGLYASAIMGCVLSVLFNNPYSLCAENGHVEIDDELKMGYTIFGPVVMTFLLWLLEECEKDGVEKLVFMSRDGFFLQKDFEALCNALEIKKDSTYIGISRQLAMAASIEDDSDLITYLSMPYSGNLTELFEDRLGVVDITEKTGYKLKDYVYENRSVIDNAVRGIRESYLAYLDREDLNDKCGIVDLGFYGNNQHYLNKLLGLNMRGYYFNANLSDKNNNAKYQYMKACYQTADDATAERSEVLKRMIFIESFLTAPYGMVKSVRPDGIFVTAAAKGNQHHFAQKETINRGVLQFIKDFSYLFGHYEIPLDTSYVDNYYGFCFKGSVLYSDKVKSSFYNDNAMMNRLESMLFY